MNQPPRVIRLPKHLMEQMEADVAAKSLEEACGFVIGKEDLAKEILPVTNILHDPFRFQMDPKQELNAFLLAENSGNEILAVYHSHPHGIDHPSVSDVNELTIPGIIYLIWFQESDIWRCRAYLMGTDSSPIEIALNVSTNM